MKFTKINGGEILNYVKIPEEIIQDISIGEKRIIVFSYLCYRRSLDDTVGFSIVELVEWSKLKPNYRPGKINQKYWSVLERLTDMNYIITKLHFDRLTSEQKNSNEYLNILLNNKKFDTTERYAIIYFDEIKKILNFKKELENTEIETNRLSSSQILLVLSYIRLNMKRALNKPRCCYRLLKTISNDIDLSERYIKRIINILDELDIVKYEEMKRNRYFDNENNICFTTTPKIFADYKVYTKDDSNNHIIDKTYDWKSEIEMQIDILENT